MTQLLQRDNVTHGNLQKHQNSNKLQQILIQRFHGRIAKLIRQTNVSHLLDSGCGEGFVLDYLMNEAGVQFDCIGSDLRIEAIQWARNNKIADFKGAVADIHALPYPDNAFPLVMCLEVLEHVPNSRIALIELARVSSQYLLLSVPHEPYFRGANFLRGKHISQWGNDPEHLHNYNGRAFRRLVSESVDVLWHGYSFPWQIILAEKRQ